MKSKMTNGLTRKLNSKRGASFVIALVLMMICLVVASLMLTAAFVNSSKSQNRLNEQQAYLAVYSAANLVANEMDDLEFKASHTDRTYSCNMHSNVAGDWKKKVAVTKEKSMFYDYINENAMTLIEDSSLVPQSSAYELVLNASSSKMNELKEYKTTVTIQMDNTYGLRALVKVQKDETTAEMTVRVGCNSKDEVLTPVIQHNADQHKAGKTKILDKERGEWIVVKETANYDITDTEYCRTFKWSEPVISEGSGVN